MTIAGNPVARREWIWGKRHWLLSLTVLFVIVGSGLMEYFWVAPWLYRRGSGWARAVSYFMIAAVFCSPMVVALFFVPAVVERERLNNGWANLATTPLSIRDMIWGKLVLPVGYVFLVGLAWTLVSTGLLFRSLHAVPPSFHVTWWVVWVSLPVSVAEDFLYALAVCLVVFRCGWRRTYGRGVVVSLVALLVLEFFLANIHFATSGFVLVASSTARWGRDPGWIFAIRSTAERGAECLLEVGVAFWFFKRLEVEMRSGLAALVEPRLG